MENTMPATSATSGANVLIHFIEDRSGSMQQNWDETVQGFKTFIQDLRTKGAADGIKYRITFTAFDTLVETPVREVPIEEIDLDLIEKYPPRGMTALYDAVGQTLETTKGTFDKYIGVIVTDGHENSSREWDKDKVHAAIDAKLNQGDWAFVYLGTQPETWDDANAIGMAAGAAINYSLTTANAGYQVTARALHGHATSANRGTRNLFSDRLTADAGLRQAGAAAGIRWDRTENSSGEKIEPSTVEPPKVEPPKHKVEPPKPSNSKPRSWR